MHSNQSLYVSIQLISLASREIRQSEYKDKVSEKVSIQLISLASREFSLQSLGQAKAKGRFHSINFSSE